MPLSSVTLMYSSSIRVTLECGGKRSATPLWMFDKLQFVDPPLTESRRDKLKFVVLKRRRRFALPAHSKLLSFELRLAFVDVCVQTFLSVFRLKQLLL